MAAPFRVRLALIATAALALSAAAPWLRIAHAAPVGSVQADTYVFESSPTTNFGTATTLEVDASPRRRIFLRVAVTGVGGSQVTSALLRLRVANQDNADSDSGGRIHHQPGCGWTETGLKWDNQPGYTAAVLDPQGPVAEGQLVEFDVTAAVPGDGTYCFVIDTLSTNVAVYNSRQASSASLRPTFVVQVGGAGTTSSTTSTSSTSSSTSTSSSSTSSTSTSSTSTSSTSTSSSTSSTSTSSTSTSSTSTSSTSSTTSTTSTSTSSTTTTTLEFTSELLGGAGELQFPGAPLTAEEAQELSQMFAGDVSVSLTYDSANLVADSGSFHYVAPGGGPPALEITVTNALGTFVYSFDEYRLFLDDQMSLDTLVFTPFLPVDATVTLSSDREVDIDIGLVWQDPTGTTLASSSTPPAELDFGLLNVRGYSFIFINDDGTGNGSMKGGLRAPQ